MVTIRQQKPDLVHTAIAQLAIEVIVIVHICYISAILGDWRVPYKCLEVQCAAREPLRPSFQLQDLTWLVLQTETRQFLSSVL